VLSPNGLAVNDVTGDLWVTSRTANLVYRFDAASGLLLGAFPVGQEPFGVAVDRTSNRVYVANFSSDTVMALNGATGAVQATIGFVPLALGEPSQVAVDEATHRVYVTLHMGERLAVIDGNTNTLLTMVPVEAGAFGVALHSGLQRAYVGSRDTSSVVVVDMATNLPLTGQKFQPGGVPFALAVDAGRNRLYVVYGAAANAPDRLAAYSLTAGGATRLGDVAIGSGDADGGVGLVVNPATGHVFVSNNVSNTVSVIDGPSLTTLSIVPVGANPGPMAFNPANNRAYVGNRGASTVQAIPDNF